MKWKLVFTAIRPFAFPTSIIPITIGSFYYWGTFTNTINWPLYILTLICGLSIHGGTNLNNDYWDYLNGVDTKDSFGSSKLLPLKEMTPEQIKLLSKILFVIGICSGLVLGVITDFRVSFIMIIGLLAGYYYTAPPLQLKYRGFGPVLVFIMMGPLLMIVGGLVQSNQWDGDLLRLSLPIACLVSLILQANDIRDMEWDDLGGITTIAILLGTTKSVIIFITIGAAAFALIPLLIWAEVLTWISALTWLFIPWFLTLIKKINKGTTGQLLNIDIQMTKLYSGIGVIILWSVIF